MWTEVLQDTSTLFFLSLVDTGLNTNEEKDGRMQQKTNFGSLILLLNSTMSFCQQTGNNPFFLGGRRGNFGQLEGVAILYFLLIYSSISCPDPAEFIYSTWTFNVMRQKARRGFFNPHPSQVWRYLKE